MAIPDSELILNKDGSIYHLNLLPDHISDTIITVGDPDRVPSVSQHFDSIETVIQKREFVTHVGYYRGKRLTVISTGMGTDNIDILLNELDALVNIDFVTREARPLEERINLRIIRVGTSGALQADIPVGSHLVTEHAVGLDSLMQFYPLVETGLEVEVAREIQQSLQLDYRPYCVRGSDLLREQLGAGMIPGNTLTCPGFYGPQGRVLRLDLRLPTLIQQFQQFRHQSAEGEFRLTNFEMETAGYYALGRMLGHEVVSLNAIVANRASGEFATNSEAVINDLIAKTLDRV
ncbi:nucleoside phosphorylase [Hymenobacter taeanensis]|uniref:Uridine phosphorylase n=1 Tax=Hymenobacter taeanensis TaxID=2735321 RepID=A0A6M6BK41_9BACT|nr:MULTISPECIES: nucleoside phosphorylase [Hymenobacter]QJX48420.1 nucleoside phosphorylase [Hymenobacter taeanensis]UOQ82086.1 nucleoside phosphorylase [Hymenobacter sp. 5414T-23]